MIEFIAWILDYYMFVLVSVGIIDTCAIVLSEEVFKLDDCIKNRRDFIRCIFMYQFAVKIKLEDEINTIGIVILEILTTFSVWFLNVIIFAVLCCLLILKVIWHIFWMIFRKREGTNKKYYKESEETRHETD